MIFFLIFSNFIPVYPEPNEIVEDFFICGVFDTFPDDSIKVFINNRRLKGKTTYSGETFTFIPENPLENGRKNLIVLVDSDTISQWICEVKKQREKGILSGNFYSGNRVYLNNNPSDTLIAPYEFYSGINITAFSRLRFKWYLSTKRLNDRIFFGYRGSALEINMFSIHPEFSDLLLKGIYTNGINLSIGKKAGASVVISRKKEYSKSPYLYGFDFYLRKNTFKSDIGIIRTFDDKNDTNLLLHSDNLIVGAGLKGTFLGYRLKLSTGISFYTKDIYGETLDTSMQLPLWIFYQNKSTIPLNPLGLTSGAFDFNIRKGFRYIRITRIGYSFINNAVPEVINDHFSFVYRDRLYIKKLSMFGGYRYWKNNLSHLNLDTRTYFEYSGGINIYGGKIEYGYSCRKTNDVKSPTTRYSIRTPVFKFISGGIDVRKLPSFNDNNWSIFFLNLPLSLRAKIYWHKVSNDFWYGSEVAFQKSFIRIRTSFEEGLNSRRLSLQSSLNIGSFTASATYLRKYLMKTYNYLSFNISYYGRFTY